MDPTVKEILASYNAAAPLAEAYTIPASWYTDSRIADLERHNVFSRAWQPIGRTEQVEKPGWAATFRKKKLAERAAKGKK